MKWYLKCLNQYADFSGRARRTEYWMFTLFNMIFTLLTLFIGALLGTALFGASGTIIGSMGLYVLYLIAIFIPGLSVFVRRLHDTGNNGWMFFILLIPLIGSIWVFVLLIMDSKPGENKWGPNPKGII
jgi:uncharacterized membrane protein YhaH (DUF805 family)